MALRSILISGANQGLGFEAAAQLLAKPDILLFLGSRNVKSGEEAIQKISVDKSSEVVLLQLDITDPKSVEKAAEKVGQVLREKKLDGLDSLVNNAGFAAGTFEQVYAVNVFGTAALTAAIRPLLSSSGSIVNVSSGVGSFARYAKGAPKTFVHPPYCSSKTALNGLTVMWAYQERENGTNVRVVSICPGYNATNLNNFGKIAPGAGDAKDGAKIIVEAALATEGESGVYYNAAGPIAW